MARGTKPVVSIEVRTQNLNIDADLHRYRLRVAVENVGNVTLEKWWLSVDVPTAVLRDSRHGGHDLMRAHGLYRHMAQTINRPGGESVTRLSFGDPFGDGSRQILHPGQRQDYDPASGMFPQFVMEIDAYLHRELSRQEPPIAWTLYLNNAHPITGGVPFTEWCRFLEVP